MCSLIDCTPVFSATPCRILGQMCEFLKARVAVLRAWWWWLGNLGSLRSQEIATTTMMTFTLTMREWSMLDGDISEDSPRTIQARLAHDSKDKVSGSPLAKSVPKAMEPNTVKRAVSWASIAREEPTS
jgi:hypothetical protein